MGRFLKISQNSIIDFNDSMGCNPTPPTPPPHPKIPGPRRINQNPRPPKELAKIPAPQRIAGLPMGEPKGSLPRDPLGSQGFFLPWGPLPWDPFGLPWVPSHGIPSPPRSDPDLVPIWSVRGKSYESFGPPFFFLVTGSVRKPTQLDFSILGIPARLL